jgi:hypothetical protein
VNALQ